MSAIPLGLGSVVGCPSMIRICFFWVETPENTNSGKALAGSGVGKEQNPAAGADKGAGIKGVKYVERCRGLRISWAGGRGGKKLKNQS